jgi:hypothetical protein
MHQVIDMTVYLCRPDEEWAINMPTNDTIIYTIIEKVRSLLRCTGYSSIKYIFSK